MRITTNLKNKVKEASKKGYTHVSSICSNHMTTDYYHFVSIDEILSTDTGENLSYGRYGGQTMVYFIKNNPNARDIRYMSLFR